MTANPHPTPLLGVWPLRFGPANRSQIATGLTRDRAGSLLATLEGGSPVRAAVIANGYPGFVRAGPVQFGTYLYGDRHLGAMGITLSSVSVAPALRL